MMQQKCELTSCVSNQFNGMLTERASNQDQRRKITYLYTLLLIATLASNIKITITFLKTQNVLRCSLRGGEKNTKRKERNQCHYCDTFFRYKHKFTKHIKHCSGRPGFIYCFQDDGIKSYENYIKHKKDFSFTVVGDLETTKGYISELEGGSMFATSSCILFNFHPFLEMTPVVCSRSFSQNEKELKFVTIPQDYIQYIDTDDYSCFLNQCDEVLKKQKKQAISTLCMIEMWTVHRCFRKYFDMVVKPTNAQLTE